MEERPMTPREAYEYMMSGGDIPAGKRGSFVFARHLLRSQAGKLAAESCVKGIEVSDDGASPWSVTVTMTDGELSRSAQVLLNAMRSNAHRAEMTGNRETARVTFFVYRLDED